MARAGAGASGTGGGAATAARAGGAPAPQAARTDELAALAELGCEGWRDAHPERVPLGLRIAAGEELRQLWRHQKRLGAPR